MNVIGNTGVKPTPFAASGVDTDSPITAKIHDDANPNRSSSAIPATTSNTLASKAKPMIRPVISRIVMPSSSSPRPANARPASTEARAVGERNRSISPLPMSSASQARS